MTQTEALYIVVWFHRKPSLKALLTTRCQPSVDFRGLCGKLSTYSSWYPRRSDTLYLGVFLDRTLTPSILPLGAGKTEFCRSVIRSLGYNGRVKSPTFTLVEPYTLSTFTLYHFDFYRFSSEEELREAGFEELIDSDAVVLVEWPERAQSALPEPDLWLRLAAGDEPESRRLETHAGTARGRACLRAMRAVAG